MVKLNNIYYDISDYRRYFKYYILNLNTLHDWKYYDASVSHCMLYSDYHSSVSFFNNKRYIKTVYKPECLILPDYKINLICHCDPP